MLQLEQCCSTAHELTYIYIKAGYIILARTPEACINNSTMQIINVISTLFTEVQEMCSCRHNIVERAI